MMHSIYSMNPLLPGSGTGAFMLHLHWLFGGLTLVGFICLTVWAVRHLGKDSLKNLSIWLLVIGSAGVLLTATPAMAGFRSMVGIWQSDKDFCGHGMNWSMMETMMDRMEDHNREQGSGDHEDMMEMMRMMRGPMDSGMEGSGDDMRMMMQ